MRRGQRGFTLIEIIVAFVLLSLVLASGFEIFSGGLRRAGDLEDYSRAIVIAQSRLASAGAEEPLRAGETQGDSEDHRFRWVVSVAPFEEEPPQPGQPQPGPGTYMLYRVEVRVSWPGSGPRDRSYQLSTLGMGVRP
jgi:general secretion pathway protein I